MERMEITVVARPIKTQKKRPNTHHSKTVQNKTIKKTIQRKVYKRQPQQTQKANTT